MTVESRVHTGTPVIECNSPPAPIAVSAEVILPPDELDLARTGDADIGGPWTNWSASSGELLLPNLMAGLESPDSGQVRLDGLDLSTLGDAAP